MNKLLTPRQATKQITDAIKKAARESGLKGKELRRLEMQIAMTLFGHPQ